MKLFISALLLLVGTGIPCLAEWETAAYLGSAHTQNADVRVRQQALGTDLLFRDVSYLGESLQSPQYYGLRAGNLFTEHFGLEAEFIHLKVFANIAESVLTSGTVAGVPTNGNFPMNTFVQRFSVSHGMNLLLVNFVARKQFLRASQEQLGRLLISGRAGAGATIPHAETEIMGFRDEHYQWGRAAFQVAGGVEARIWRKLYGLAEYKFSLTDQRFRVAAGGASTLLGSHHGVFGLAIHF